MRIFSKTLVFIAGLTMFSTGMQAQKERPQQQDEIDKYVVDDRTYDQVLDLVFPRNALWGAGGYALVLRYKPTYEAESQITILNRAGAIEIVEYTAIDGNIYHQLKKILRRVGDFNAKDAAKEIRIRRRVVRASPALVKRFRDSFYYRLRVLTRHERHLADKVTGTISAVEDGTQYLLWYRGQGMVQFDLIGTNVDSQALPDESPMIVWMKDVYRRIRKLGPTSTRQRIDSSPPARNPLPTTTRGDNQRQQVPRYAASQLLYRRAGAATQRHGIAAMDHGD
jgi:hypothetical protein